MDRYDTESLVQSHTLINSGKQDRYAHEDMPIIEFKDASLLYQTLALRFLEWVEKNPTGVVSIAPAQQFAPFFSAVSKILTPAHDLSKLIFIQLYEVIDAQRSYAAVIKKFMAEPWKLNDHQYHLINGSTTPEDYESLITRLGGIGLSILPLTIDGNVGFNNFSHEPTQRIISTMDYTTAAISAHDLGGIQQTLNKKLFHLGTTTLFGNPSTTMIIVAVGHNKAEALASLTKQRISNAVVYTTTSTTRLLAQRFYSGLSTKESKHRYAITHLMNTAFQNNTSLKKLSHTIYNQDSILSQYPQPQLCSDAQRHLEDAIKCEMVPITNKKFLHTSPHHDDIALGYLPLFDRLIGSGNSQSIVTMTSGANAVTDDLLFSNTRSLLKFINKFFINGNLDPGLRRGDLGKVLNTCIHAMSYRRRPVSRFFDTCKIRNSSSKNKAVDQKLLDSIKHNPKLIFFLKGCLREWEDEQLWHHIGIEKENVHHLRLGFYHGQKNSNDFSFEHDILPVYELIEKTMPDIITVAQDPEDSGPETHTKVLAIIKQAIDLFLKNYPTHNLEIWGYRNVWNTFHLSEANMIIPVTNTELDAFKTNFMTFYQSQLNAQFPYALYQDSFCNISANTMIKNLAILRTLLGEKHPLLALEQMSNAAGVLFLHISDGRIFTSVVD